MVINVKLVGWLLYFTSDHHNNGYIKTEVHSAHDLRWWSPIQVLTDTVVDVT